MKHHLQSLIEHALGELRASGELAVDAPAVPVERARADGHGDFASPVALGLAKQARRKPREIAELIVGRMPESESVERIEIAGPGFINLFLRDSALRGVVDEVLAAGEEYGRVERRDAERIQVEFVSANPTGPLHVGHGRGAAYGAACANLLAAAGHEVQREYYVNDAGRQMDILATSVWLRYLEAAGEAVPFPANGYRGDYIRPIAAALAEERGDALVRPAADVVRDLPPDEPAGGDKETHVDAVVRRAHELLGKGDYRIVLDRTLDAILGDIREDLESFGVFHDVWYSERGLAESGAVERAIGRLRELGHAYERDGATWFRSSAFGDEKDRVLVRENGAHTYFASDVAYHMEKFERGFGRVIDVWGADHHGYVARVKGALAALGRDPERFDVLLVQFAVLYRGGEKVQMSTRSGEFVTLRELREEVGNDAARFFYVMRRSEQHLDFDLDLAKSDSNENPVYYVQYAHARVASLARQCAERGWRYAPAPGRADLARLAEPQELALARTLSRLPEVIEAAAAALEPHQMTTYLREVANDFHTFYNAHQILVDDDALREARLALAAATRQVIANGLALLGVSAPERM